MKRLMNDEDLRALDAMHRVIESLLRVEREAERASAALVAEEDGDLRRLLRQLVDRTEARRHELSARIVAFRNARRASAAADCDEEDEVDA